MVYVQPVQVRLQHIQNLYTSIYLLIGWQDLMWCFVPIKIHVYTYGFCASKVATLRSAQSFDATQRAVLWLSKAFSKKPDMFYISAMYIYIDIYIYIYKIYINLYLQFIYVYIYILNVYIYIYKIFAYIYIFIYNSLYTYMCVQIYMHIPVSVFGTDCAFCWSDIIGFK